MCNQVHTIYWEIFEDGLLVTIDYYWTSAFCVVKISRLQANPRNYFTSKISQYTVCVKTTKISQYTVCMKTTESKAKSSLLQLRYMCFADIVNSGVCEAYAHVYHLVYILSMIELIESLYIK